MVARSYLSPAEAASINQVRRNALATRIALQEPQVAIVLYRFNEGSGGHDPLSAQTVLLRYAKRQADERRSAAAAAQYSAGTFAKEVPFNVKVGDRFALANGQPGVIETVSISRAGIVRATWSVDVGVPA